MDERIEIRDTTSRTEHEIKEQIKERYERETGKNYSDERFDSMTGEDKERIAHESGVEVQRRYREEQ